jgi:hypothetical protein
VIYAKLGASLRPWFVAKTRGRVGLGDADSLHSKTDTCQHDSNGGLTKRCLDFATAACSLRMNQSLLHLLLEEYGSERGQPLISPSPSTSLTT